MRRKINNELKQYLLGCRGKYTVDELLPKVNKKFKEHYDKNSLRKYMWRNKIPYKHYNKNMIRNMGNKIPIGTEYTKPDGMVLVKVDKNKWVYKQRYIYEKYHNVKLTNNDFIIFLDGDRTNFKIKNLKLLNRQEASYLGVFKYDYEVDKVNKDIIETEISIAKLIIKTKDMRDKL